MLYENTLEVWFMRSLAENKTAKIRVSRVFDNREWVENDESRTKPVGRVTFRHFFYGAILRPAAVCAAVWARFAVCHARAAWRARYSSVTLAPRGEFVFINFHLYRHKLVVLLSWSISGLWSSSWVTIDTDSLILSRKLFSNLQTQ